MLRPMLKETPPFSVLSAGLAIALLLFFLALQVASDQPWLGLSAEPSAEGVRVVRIDSDGPAAGVLHEGELLLAVRSGAGSLVLESWDAVAEPDDAREYAVYNRFFERHAQLWAILHGDGLQLQIQAPSADPAAPSVTRWVDLQPKAQRGLTQLPLLFWYQVGCGLAVLLMGVAAWAFVQTERGPLLYFAGGAGHSGGNYRQRCLHHAGADAGARLVPAALASQPGRRHAVRRHRYGPVLVLPVAVGALPDRARDGAGGAGHARRQLAAVVPRSGYGGALSVAGVVCGGHSVRLYPVALDPYEPVARARLKWLLAAWFAGAFGYLLLVIFPQVIGYPSVAHQTHAWAFFVLTYLGIALGIVRYRLFDLDRWILLAWFWFAFGVLFIVLDAFLILLLDLETSMGLLVSLAVVGWCICRFARAFCSGWRLTTRVVPCISACHAFCSRRSSTSGRSRRSGARRCRRYMTRCASNRPTRWSDSQKSGTTACVLLCRRSTRGRRRCSVTPPAGGACLIARTWISVSRH
ncbi:hypothetical protein ULG90_22850 [Halopseudomonas pachastrellae]|nr:hypothetical protein ULG90_22850 [Halopseudomonas pachastrellae]